MSREIDLRRSGDAHFVTRARVSECDGDVIVTRTVVVVGRNDGPSEVCKEELRMSHSEWLAVLPLLNEALGVKDAAP